MAGRAFRFLNFMAPERALPIAIDFIKSEDKMWRGISVINYQMSYSKNIAEKDEWVAYLASLLEDAKDEIIDEYSEERSNKEAALYCLESLYYHKALYEIINYEHIDNDYKARLIRDKKMNLPIFLEVLENTPTDYDIEMIIKAVEIAPLHMDELIEPLKTAVKDSKKDYNISGLIKKVNDALLAEEKERASRQAEDEIS